MSCLFRVFLFFLATLVVYTPFVYAGYSYHNYAAIAVNTKTGEVLYSQHPERLVHLASITKIMTLYLTFEALKEGRVALNDKVVISEVAARQIEKKMHLVRGAKYTLKELIMFSAIFSANDATVAIAEEVAGGVDDFVYLMNQKAMSMGLSDTRYSNVTGVPGAINQSTARDTVKLAQRIRDDFPQYYAVFGKELMAYNGKVYGNSNRLLPYFKGLDGLKTGFLADTQTLCRP